MKFSNRKKPLNGLKLQTETIRKNLALFSPQPNRQTIGRRKPVRPAESGEA